MNIDRRFTRAGESPYTHIPFSTRSSEIRNPDGSIVFQLEDVQAPDQWSQLAVDILAQKYFRKAGISQRDANGEPVKDEHGNPIVGGERDARQVFHRLAGCWTQWARPTDILIRTRTLKPFTMNCVLLLAKQMAAPNSPQWFNTGLHYAYDINGPSQGHYFVAPHTNALNRAKNAYERPRFTPVSFNPLPTTW